MLEDNNTGELRTIYWGKIVTCLCIVVSIVCVALAWTIGYPPALVITFVTSFLVILFNYLIGWA